MGILDKLLNEDVLTSIDNMIINGMSQDIFLKNPSFPFCIIYLIIARM